jgi:hypothetical protein
VVEAKVGVPVEIELGTVAGDGPIDVDVTGPAGATWRVPAFRTASGSLRIRFAAPEPGTYTHADGRFRAAPYDGTNPLYRHGRLQVAADRRTLEHVDGAPFLWFGDTWWMGFTRRLDWPDGFATLLGDRVAKGFSVIQIVAGPLPDFSAEPDGIWHPQQANEGGWSWEPGWERLNPAYFDDADRRIAAIVEAGIVPCIVGMWGYYEHVMGAARIRRHWRELVARWAAYPVVFCVAGEINLAGYEKDVDTAVRDARRAQQLETWTDIAREVRALDPFGNLITAHPALPDARTLLRDPDVLDVNMIQSSHWGYHEPPARWRADIARELGLPEPLPLGFAGTISLTRETVAQEPPMPVVNGEPAYEGILGGNLQDVQRFEFWTGWLSGLAGYTYGADSIWQMSSATEAFANQVSRWGNATWQQAMHYEGGRQVALGVSLLRGLPWWTMRPVSQGRAAAAGRIAAFGAIGDRISLHYLPSTLLEERLQGMRGLPVDVPPAGRARFIDPASLVEHDLGRIEPSADGTWLPPETPTYADWLLLVEDRPG